MQSKKKVLLRPALAKARMLKKTVTDLRNLIERYVRDMESDEQLRALTALNNTLTVTTEALRAQRAARRHK